MVSWNKWITVFWNYANSDEALLTDASRPRDPYWFRLSNKAVNNILWAINEWDKAKFFKAQRYINISWGNTSYQDIPFKPWDNQTAKDIGLIFSQYWDLAEINKDWFIKLNKWWLYQVNVIAQYIKDDEWTSANLYWWPCWWYIRKEAEKDKRDNKPHMIVSYSNISFVLDLKAGDVLVPEAWWTVNWTIWVSMLKLW